MVFARYNREKTHPRVRFLFYSLTAIFPQPALVIN